MNAALKRIFPVIDRSSFRLPVRTERNSCHYSARPPRPHRSGISLIEVLIAVFVLTFGLMGIAMVIPAGRYLMVEAAKSDRGSACGRAALNDMKIRGWLLPGQSGIDWVKRDSGGLQSVFLRGGQIYYDVSYGDAFAIDPLFYAAPANSGNIVVQHFPYRNPNVTQAAPETVLMTRVTIGTDGTTLSLPIAERILTWQDDVVFSTQTDEDRPRQLAIWDNGDSASFPNLPGDVDTIDPAVNSPIVRQSEGKFSWLATVVPVLNYTGDFPVDWNNDKVIDEMRQTIKGIGQYEVSIVVFYGRDLYCPTADELNSGVETPKERSVYARIDGGGLGGGDVYLMSQNRDWLELRKNSWIMLKGREVAFQIGTFAVRRNVFKWYRVVNLDDIVDGQNLPNGQPGFGRYVTLAGPDWQVRTTPADIAEAAIIDDVVGVYTTLVDVNSL
jgi:hypothetical protein